MSFMRSQLRLNFSYIKSCYRSLHLEKYEDKGFYKVANSKSKYFDSIFNFVSKKCSISTGIFKKSIFPNSNTTGENVEVSSNIRRKQVPNDAARGIKKLDRSLFTYPVKVLGIKVPHNEVDKFTKVFYKCLARCAKFEPVATLNESDLKYETHELVLIESSDYKTSEEFTSKYAEELAKLSVDVNSCTFYNVTLNYENWNHDEILECILPEESDDPWCIRIGRIGHLTLKDDLIEYKHVIGEVFLDKIYGVKTVVTKNTIDNTFRNFQTEVLAGEENFVTFGKGRGSSFELDFSKVYWNPTLLSEHWRIVELVSKYDVLFDVFAGVGPFSIPCAKRGSKVFANDLNPHSVHWLNKNVKRNKVLDGKIEVFNMDGRDFIKNVVRPELLKILISNLKPKDFYQMFQPDQNVHIPMNLPTLAVEFLDAFPGLLSEQSISEITSSDCNKEESVKEGSNTKVKTTHKSNKIDAALASAAIQKIDHCGLSNIYVHCHTFRDKADPKVDVIKRVKAILGLDTLTFHRTGVQRVWNDVPNKEMLCISVRLPWELLLRKHVEKRGLDLGDSTEPDL